jgi:hypothetical protein
MSYFRKPMGDDGPITSPSQVDEIEMPVDYVGAGASASTPSQPVPTPAPTSAPTPTSSSGGLLALIPSVTGGLKKLVSDFTGSGSAAANVESIAAQAADNQDADRMRMLLLIAAAGYGAYYLHKRKAR